MRVAAVQLTSTADRPANLEAADRLTREAAAGGADLVVLPEKWSVLGTPDDLLRGRGDARRAVDHVGARRGARSSGSTS